MLVGAFLLFFCPPIFFSAGVLFFSFFLYEGRERELVGRGVDGGELMVQQKPPPRGYLLVSFVHLGESPKKLILFLYIRQSLKVGKFFVEAIKYCGVYKDFFKNKKGVVSFILLFLPPPFSKAPKGGGRRPKLGGRVRVLFLRVNFFFFFVFYDILHFITKHIFLSLFSLPKKSNFFLCLIFFFSVEDQKVGVLCCLI